MRYLLSSQHMLLCREREVQEILHEREKKASKKLKVDLQSLQKKKKESLPRLQKFSSFSGNSAFRGII